MESPSRLICSFFGQREHIFLNEGRSLGSPRCTSKRHDPHHMECEGEGWFPAPVVCVRWDALFHPSPHADKWGWASARVWVRARTFRMKINRLELIYRNLSLGRVPSTYIYTNTISGHPGQFESEGTSWKWVDKVSMRLAWPQRRLRLSLLPPVVFHAIFVWGRRIIYFQVDTTIYQGLHQFVGTNERTAVTRIYRRQYAIIILNVSP